MAAKVGVFTRSLFERPFSGQMLSKASAEKRKRSENTEVKPPDGLGVSVFGYEAQIAAFNIFTVSSHARCPHGSLTVTDIN